MDKRDLALDTTPPEAFVQPRPYLEPKNQLANDLREAITGLYSQAQRSTTSSDNPRINLDRIEARKQAIDEAYNAMRDMSTSLSDTQNSLHQSVELDPLLSFPGDTSLLKKLPLKEVTFSKERPAVIPAASLSESDLARITPKQIYTLLQSMNGANESINNQVIEGLENLRQNLAKVVEDNNILNSELMKLHEENQQKSAMQAHLVSLLEKREQEIENLKEAIKHSEEMEGKKNEEIRSYLLKCDEIRSISERTLKERDTVLDELKAKMSNTTADYKLLEAEADRTSRELIECKTRLQTAESQVISLNSKLTALASTSETTLLRKESEIEKLSLEISNLKEFIQSVNEERRNEADMHSKQIQEIQERANKDIERVGKEKQDLMTQLANFNTENTALLLKKDEDFGSLREEYDVLAEEYKIYKATTEMRLKLLEDNLEKANSNAEKIAEEKTTLLNTLTAEMQSVREESKAAVQAAEADTELIQARLAETIRDRDRQIKEAKNNIIDLQNEMTELRKNQEFLINDGNSTQERLNAQLKGLCNRYAVLQAQSQSDIAAQEEKLAQLNSEFSLAKKIHEQYIADTDARISMLNEQLESNKNDYMANIDEKEAQIRELYNIIEQQETKFIELLGDKERELTQMIDTNEKLKQRREEELAQMSQLQSQLEQSHAERSAVKTTGEMEQLKLQSELEMIRTKAEMMLKTNTTEVERLQSELLNSKSMFTEMKKDMESQLKAKDEIIEKLNETISALKTELAETTMDATIKIQELNGRLEMFQQVQMTTDNTRLSDADQLKRQLEEQQEHSEKEIAHYRQQISKLMEDLADVNARYANSVEKREREILRLKQESKDEAIANATKLTNLTAELMGAKRRIEKEQTTVAEIANRQSAKISDLQEKHKKEIEEKDAQIEKLQTTLTKLKAKYSEKIADFKATVTTLVAQNGYDTNITDADVSLPTDNLNSSITVSSLNPGPVTYVYPQNTFYDQTTALNPQQTEEQVLLQIPQVGTVQGLMLTPRMSNLGNTADFMAKPTISMTPGSMGAM